MTAYAPEIERMMKRLFDSLRENDRRRSAAIEATKLAAVQKQLGSWAQIGIGPHLTSGEVLGSASGVNATLCSRSPSHGLSDPILYG